jgi:hypothetical protein
VTEPAASPSGGAGNLWRRRSLVGKILIVIAGLFVLFLLIGIVGAIAGAGDENESAQRSDIAPPPPPQEEPPPPPAEEPPPPPPPAKPKGDPDVDKHTREYVRQVKACRLAVGVVLLQIREGKATDIELADSATSARDTCDAIRSRLVTMNTDHFDDQATTAWSGVDRYKSGLNAMLAYIDNPAPSKLIEARDKLQEGDQSVSQGLREINARGRVYNLKPLPVRE